MLDKRLLGLLGDDKKRLFLVTALNIVTMLCSVGITACICFAINLAVCGISAFSAYIAYIVIAIVALIVRHFCSLKVANLKSGLGNNIKSKLRNDIVSKMYRLGIGGNSQNTASMTQMSIEGVEQLDLYFTSYLPQFFYAMIAPLILFVICVFIEWKTALVLIACIPLIPVSIIAVSKYAKKIFAKYWGKYTSMGDGFLDALSGMKELKIFNADEDKQRAIAVKSEEFRKITMKVLVMQLVSITIMDLVAFGGAGVAIIVSLNSANAEAIVPMQALFLILISAEFFLPMRALGSAFHVAMNGATAGKNILAFLDEDELIWGDKQLDALNSVSLKNVEFSYVKDNIILNDISLTFNRGLNALVGESGSGKSTIATLLLGSKQVNSGVILYNDNNIFLYDRSSLYGNVGLVGCNTFVFNDSIRNNFKLSNSNVSDQEIYSALAKVNLLEFVESVGGLDYVVLEESENISGGQRQRLALAISLVSPKQMYIFDEATSNIDIESEAIVMKNILELSKTSIVVLISHRLQNVVDSDMIFMLDGGKVVESGSHSQLMEADSVYCNLFTKQFMLENGYKGETK